MVDNIKFESCGAHLRNLLGPYQNLVTVLEVWQSGGMKDDILIKILKKQPLQDGVNRIIDFSKCDVMEKANWRDSQLFKELADAEEV